jgi:secretion/DNA translocation related TadE-like protein
VNAHDDRGVATIWAAAGVSVIMVALLVGVHLGAAVAARHRAEAAADLAALAAAGRAVEGIDAACHRARTLAAAMGASITSCQLVGWDALVEAEVPVAVALPGTANATGRARAGPEPTAVEPPPSDRSAAGPARPAAIPAPADYPRDERSAEAGGWLPASSRVAVPGARGPPDDSARHRNARRGVATDERRSLAPKGT